LLEPAGLSVCPRRPVRPGTSRFLEFEGHYLMDSGPDFPLDVDGAVLEMDPAFEAKMAGVARPDRCLCALCVA
ncbi:MAG: hypothetical protein AB1758_19600, partial [Candidatus Eremiobacterota bacterium]